MLYNAPYNEYTQKNLASLKRQHQGRMDKMYQDMIHINSSASVDGSSTTQSMNVNWIISKEKNSRFKNVTPDENFKQINKYIEQNVALSSPKNNPQEM